MKPLVQLCVSAVLDSFYGSHEMTVMVAVAVVVPKHTPIVHSADSMIDVCQVVPNDFSVLPNPNLFI